MNIEKISSFFCYRRKIKYKHGVQQHYWSLCIRRIIHPILLKLIKMDRCLSHEKLVVLNRKRVSNRNVIYACTHIGGNDIQRVFEAIYKHAYLFLGDPGNLYFGYLGGILFLNGAIYVELNNKEDRKIAEFRTNELLHMGGSIVLFPEGAWNIEPSMPVMKLFPGVIRMARKTNCEIIPIAVEVYDDTYIVNIGDGFRCSNSKISDYDYLVQLRDNLASLKWEIFETQGISERKRINRLSDEEYADRVINRVDWGYNINDVMKTRFHEKA